MYGSILYFFKESNLFQYELNSLKLFLDLEIRIHIAQDLLHKVLSDKTLPDSPRISELIHTLLETYSNIAQPLVF